MGYPLHMSEMLSRMDGAGYVVRRSLHDPKNIRLAKKAIRTAFETQKRGLGFSMVELLSTCNTNWGMTVPGIIDLARRTHDPHVSHPGFQGLIRARWFQGIGKAKEGNRDMQTEVIFAGFGGQGVLFAGQVLAFAAMDAGHDVTWMPSYGPEMRGGTANCTVVIADEEIGSPTVKHPKAAVVMNLPSLDKFEPLVSPGGVLIVNSSLVNRDPCTHRYYLADDPCPGNCRNDWSTPFIEYGHAGSVVG